MINKPKRGSVVQKLASFISSVTNIITLLRAEFIGLLNMILLMYQLMTFPMTLVILPF
jgi:hypothetical protein